MMEAPKMQVDTVHRIRRVLLGVAVALATAAPAMAITELDAFRKTLEKRTAAGDFKRGACVCKETALLNRLGTIQLATFVSSGFVDFEAECEVPTFDETTGDSVGSVDCGANWIPLPK